MLWIDPDFSDEESLLISLFPFKLGKAFPGQAKEARFSRSWPMEKSPQSHGRSRCQQGWVRRNTAIVILWISETSLVLSSLKVVLAMMLTRLSPLHWLLWIRERKTDTADWLTPKSPPIPSTLAHPTIKAYKGKISLLVSVEARGSAMGGSVYPQNICWSSNPQYFRTCPYLEIGRLKV